MTKIHPNIKGLNEALKAPAGRAVVEKAAEEIAANVRSLGVDVEGIPGDIELPVRVDYYESDRSRATVWLAHPAGLAVEAKHGALTKAASAAGLEVKGD